MIPDESRRLLAEADSIRSTIVPDDRIRLDLISSFSNVDNLIPSCEAFCNMHPIIFDKNRMWWIWNARRYCYERADDVDVFNKLYSVLKTSHIIGNKTRGQLKEAFQMVGRSRNPKELNRRWIQFRDKIIDMNYLDDGFQIISPTPEFMLTNPINYEFKEVDSPPESIDKIFRQWVRPEDLDKLYEILGYCMLPDNPLHRIFCLVGSGRNGKSKFLAIIRKIIGLENITAIDIEKLGSSNFESSSLFNKLVAMAGETNFNTLQNTKLLKELSGEDLVRGEFKHISKFEFINYAKTIIATNGLPTTADKSEGFYGRWIIIDFPNKFDESRDILADITEEDYEKLANYALFRLKRLLKNRLFTNEGTLHEKTMKYEEKSNPINKFINTHCERGIDYEVFFWEFRDKIFEYFANNGIRKRTDKELSSMIKDIGLETGRKNIGEDKKWTVIYGIKFKEKDATDAMDTVFDFISTHRENKVEHDVHRVHHVREDMNIHNQELKNKILLIYPSGEPESYFNIEANAENIGIDAIYLEKIHELLEKEGKIFSPRPGFWKRL